jgi:membrane-associated phospholipid phosphatase
VHWATDVLAGFAAGSLLLLAAGLARRRLCRNGEGIRHFTADANRRMV